MGGGAESSRGMSSGTQQRVLSQGTSWPRATRIYLRSVKDPFLPYTSNERCLSSTCIEGLKCNTVFTVNPAVLQTAGAESEQERIGSLSGNAAKLADKANTRFL